MPSLTKLHGKGAHFKQTDFSKLTANIHADFGQKIKSIGQSAFDASQSARQMIEIEAREQEAFTEAMTTALTTKMDTTGVQCFCLLPRER